MAKKSFFGTLAKLGGLAAATAVVYYKREEIRKTVQDVLDRCFPDDETPEETEEEEEIEIVIDTTEQETKETVEETPEI